jgi:hypothetical protein
MTMADAIVMQNHAPAADSGEQERLQKLVGELLAANQELRFRLAQTEQRAAGGERQFAEAAAVYGMLML